MEDPIKILFKAGKDCQSLAVGRSDCSPDKSDRLYRRVFAPNLVTAKESGYNKQADHTTSVCRRVESSISRRFDRPVSSAIRKCVSCIMNQLSSHKQIAQSAT